MRVENHGSESIYGIATDGRMWQFDGGDSSPARPAGSASCGYVADDFRRFRKALRAAARGGTTGVEVNTRPGAQYWFVTEDKRCAQFWLDNEGRDSLPAAQFTTTSLQEVNGSWYLVGTESTGEVSMYALSATTNLLKATRVLGGVLGKVSTMYSSQAGCLLSTAPTQTGME